MWLVKGLEDRINYITYESTTMTANISQPEGPTRLCLSCHDGTIAVGKVLTTSSQLPIEMENLVNIQLKRKDIF